MKYLLLLTLVLLASNISPAQEYKLDTLLFNGPSVDRINYVILGDGYLVSQMSLFLDDAQTLTNKLFNATPYKEYIDYFNIFTISVPSNESGAANNPNNLIDNYFGSTFNYAGIERLLVPTNQSRITEVLANHFPSYDQVIMLVNSSKYGGSGGWVATASTHDQSNEIAIHELGHSFAGLADEYWAGAQYVRETYNMTQQSSPNLIRWKNWLNDENIAILPHSGNSSWKKPHSNCKMQFLGSPFCAVCREQFIRVFHQSISSIDDYNPKFLSSVDDKIDFEISLVTPNPNTVQTSWLLNGLQIAMNVDSIEVNKTDLNDKNNVLTVKVYDETTYDRRNSIYINSVTWNISNGISSSKSTKEEDRGKYIITSVELINKENIVISVFPNPTSDQLKIEYELQRPSNIQLSLINMNGQLIKTIYLENRHSGKQKAEIDLSQYDQGVYFLKFESAFFEQTIPIIKGI
ncbi:M64 family metallopeptidase [Ekhidna sp.]|uniref:T9SS type A sorting domain-containing protein n=1 Tax=Ekhidna sp. TaxID=2608089 RepID=UPI003BAD9E50